MKTELFASLIVILLVVPQATYAFQNEPDGFRGIKWESNIESIPNMIFTSNGLPAGEKLYIRKNDKLKIGDAVLQNIFYIFYKGKFLGVYIGYKSFANFNRLKDTLFQQYGAGGQYNEFLEKYHWRGKRVDIFLDYNSISEEGSIIYSFKPLAEAEKAAEKEKTKEGAGDL